MNKIQATIIRSHIRRAQYLDLDWCIKLNRYSTTKNIAVFFKIISRLGDGWFWYAGLLVMWFVQGLQYYWQMLYVILAMLSATTIYKLLKQKTLRPRPYQVHQAVVLGERPLDHFSFPSGHTLHAVMLCILIGYIVPAMLVLLLPFTLLVAVSRVILGLHYPSDVMAGATIGAVLAAFFIAVAPWFKVLL
jgi:undecaprenyl-diphosphatase